MLRVFFGLELAEDCRRALGLVQFLLPLPRRVDPADFHLTLAFLGERSDADVETAHEVALAVRAAPFRLHLQGLGLFGGEKPRVAFAGLRPEPGLMALEQRLVAGLRHAGLAPEARNFHPHVTLGRFSPPLRGEEAMRLERAVALTPLDGPGMEVRDFSLFRSDPHRAPPHYSVLARYPLQDQRLQ